MIVFKAVASKTLSLVASSEVIILIADLGDERVAVIGDDVDVDKGPKDDNSNALVGVVGTR